MYRLINERGEWLSSVIFGVGGLWVYYVRKDSAATFSRSDADKIIAFLSGFGYEFRAEGV